jgi:HPt (histidine-containing phosphotransfer) domain-containing protein
MKNDELIIPGVNVQKGISLTGGKTAFYFKVLTLFCKDAEGRLPLLQTAPEPESLPTFITQVHSLKSISSSIGAQEVSNRAAELEAAAKTGNLAILQENLAGFVEQLTELIKNIKAVLELQNAEKKEPPPVPSPQTLLKELKAALESQNTTEIDRILEELNKKTLDSKTTEALGKISDDVLMTEFDNALKTVSALLEGEAHGN